MHPGVMGGEPVIDVGAAGQEVRGLQHVLGTQPVAAFLQGGAQVLFQPVVDDVEESDLGRGEVTDQLAQRGGRAAVGLAAQHRDLVAAGAQAAREAIHRCPVQHQLLGVELVLPEEQVVFDQHEPGLRVGVEVFFEELMRQHQPQRRRSGHGLSR